jgi:protein O-GlcNAc transferase
MCFDGKRPVCAVVLFALLGMHPSRAQVHTSADKARDADAAFHAGYAALSNHKLEEARGDFQKVVNLVPQIEEGHSALGAVLLQLNAYPEAISELNQALKLKPEDDSAQTNLAMAYANSGRDGEAVPLFIKLDQSATSAGQPLPVDVLLAYARSLAATGQTAGATERIKQAVTLSPSDAACVTRWALFTRSSRSGRSPRMHLQPRSASIPSSPSPIFILGSCS